MTSQKLYEILRFVDELDKKLKLQPSLEAIASSLSNLVSQPAAPQHQSSLANALAAFSQAASHLSESVTPSQQAMIDAMGGGEFFDPTIAEKVTRSVQTNAMTPSVAKDFVQDLVNKRGEFLSVVRNARQNLEKLNITSGALKPGSADLAFLIPRNIFENQLTRFAKELTFLSRLLEHFGEALTGETTHVELEQLSSSVPTVALAASVPVIGALALVVNKFLEAWEKIERIRKVRAELAEMGMKGAAIDELTEQITTTVDEVVEEATTVVVAKYHGSTDRKHELENAVRQDTRRLFGQIERGLTVEFRAEPKKDGNAEEQKALADISSLARVMQFPELTQQPMLLKGDEVVEGDIQAVKHKKTTTTRKTTVSRKGVPPDGGGTEVKT